MCQRSSLVAVVWLAIYRPVGISMEPGDASVSYSNLGAQHRRAGRLAEAEACYRQVIEIRTSLHGPDHTDTAIARNNLAVVLITMGKYADAESNLRQALTAAHLTMGDRSAIEVTLGNVLRLERRLAESRSHYLNSLYLDSVLGRWTRRSTSGKHARLKLAQGG